MSNRVLVSHEALSAADAALLLWAFAALNIEPGSKISELVSDRILANVAALTHENLSSIYQAHLCNHMCGFLSSCQMRCFDDANLMQRCSSTVLEAKFRTSNSQTGIADVLKAMGANFEEVSDTNTMCQSSA